MRLITTSPLTTLRSHELKSRQVFTTIYWFLTNIRGRDTTTCEFPVKVNEPGEIAYM